MASKQEIWNPKMVISAVLRYIDENRNQVSSWDKPQQEQGLQTFIENCDQRLMKSTTRGTSTGSVHTGITLRNQLLRFMSDQKKNVNQLFSQGLDVLPLSYLIESGLRPQAGMADDSIPQNGVRGQSTQTEEEAYQALAAPGHESEKPVTRAASKHEREANPTSSQENSSDTPHPRPNMSTAPLSRLETPGGDDIANAQSRKRVKKSPPLHSPVKESTNLGEETWYDGNTHIASVALEDQDVPSITLETSTVQDEAATELDTLSTHPKNTGSPLQDGENIGISRDEIQNTMRTLGELVDQIVHGLIPSETHSMVLVHTPHPELEALYSKIFGSGFWCEKRAFLKPAPSDPDMMKSLVAAWLLTQVLDKPTPWRVDHEELLAPGTIWYEAEAVLGRQNIKLRQILVRASFQRFNDPTSVQQELSGRIKVLTDEMSMTLLPHISSLPTERQIVPNWRTSTEKAVGKALLLKAKMEATPKLRFRWTWIESGSPIDEDMEVLYQGLNPESSVVGITIWPGITIGERDHEMKRAERPCVVRSAEWAGCRGDRP